PAGPAPLRRCRGRSRCDKSRRWYSGSCYSLERKASTRSAATQPELTLPIEQYQDFPFSATLLADAPGVPMRTLEEAIWRVDGGQAINRSFTLADDLDAQTRDARFFANATGLFAALALVLGAGGINAVVA